MWGKTIKQLSCSIRSRNSWKDYKQLQTIRMHRRNFLISIKNFWRVLNVLPWKQIYSHRSSFFFLLGSIKIVSHVFSKVDLFSKKDNRSNQFYTWLQFDKIPHTFRLQPSVPLNHCHRAKQHSAMAIEIFLYSRTKPSIFLVLGCIVVERYCYMFFVVHQLQRYRAHWKIAWESLLATKNDLNRTELESSRRRPDTQPRKNQSNVETAKSLCHCQQHCGVKCF